MVQGCTGQYFSLYCPKRSALYPHHCSHFFLHFIFFLVLPLSFLSSIVHHTFFQVPDTILRTVIIPEGIKGIVRGIAATPWQMIPADLSLWFCSGLVLSVITREIIWKQRHGTAEHLLAIQTKHHDQCLSHWACVCRQSNLLSVCVVWLEDKGNVHHPQECIAILRSLNGPHSASEWQVIKLCRCCRGSRGYGSGRL